jgi:predicted pyridoxine 5'-phosphate oxidase superfamily flavin-nucleotide-binding protein
MNQTNEPRASPWHTGELRLQETVGVVEVMEVNGLRVIRDYMPDQHRLFYSQLPYLLLGVVEEQSVPWVTLIESSPGFVHYPDPRVLQLDCLSSDGDPVKPALRNGAAVRLQGIDPKTRRRNRMNGIVSSAASGGCTVSVVQAFGNCPVRQRSPVVAPPVKLISESWASPALKVNTLKKSLPSLRISSAA